jgi:hypothetical protein
MTNEFEKINKQQEYIRWEQKRKGVMTEKELQDHITAGVLDWAEFKQLVHEEIVGFLRTDEIMGPIIRQVFNINEKEFLSDEEVIDTIRGMKVEIEYLKQELDRFRAYTRRDTLWE